MIKADNLIFLEPLSIRLPSELYDLIETDARLFGFRKNGKGNINGFLNKLLPSIIDVFSNISNCEFFDNLNENISPIIKKAMLNLDYIYQPMLKGNNVTLSFRVNKTHENEFRNIYQNILPVYNMDFSVLFRSLLTFYVTNRLAIRERFVNFKNYTEISHAIAENKQCLFFLKEETVRMSGVAIFVSPISDRNVLLGINQATGNATVFPFHLVETAILQNEDSVPLKGNHKMLRRAFLEYIKIEKKLQER